MLFLLKVAITPLLVGAVSLASRWWGPTVGGILMGLPWMTGPVLFVLVQEKGTNFGVTACVGIELGVVCISAFILTYGLVSTWAGWPLSLTAAVAAFAAGALATQDPNLLPALTDNMVEPLWAASCLGLVSLLAIYVLLPVPRARLVLHNLPWWDIPMRMATTAALVTALMLTADALGPQLSGIVSTYPVILTVVGTFTHHRWGPEAVWSILRGLTRSLVTFVAFFLVVGLTLPTVGLAGAYLLASVVAIALASLLFALNSTRAAR
jgi:hypothetical protein